MIGSKITLSLPWWYQEGSGLCGARLLGKRQRLPCRTARRSVPTPAAVRPNNAGLTTHWPFSGKLREGDVSDSAASTVPDRSEIGPYPRGHSANQRGSYHPLANLRRAPGVGRCLRQRRVHGAGPLGDRSLPQRRFGQTTRVLPPTGHSQASSEGRAMSPTAPRPRCRTARRSVPTPAAIRPNHTGLTTHWPIPSQLRG